jgi:hypothetical protein
MARFRAGAFSVVIHDAETPGSDEWAAWVKEYRVIAGKLKGLLIYSLGGGPNGQQRHELTSVFGEIESNPPACIVTSSIAMRGIVTAIRWFLPASQRVKCFALNDLERAMTELGMGPDVRKDVPKLIENHLKTLVAPDDARRAG